MRLTLVPTHQCNLRCSFCSTGARSDRRMADEVAQQALQLAFREPGPVVVNVDRP